MDSDGAVQDSKKRDNYLFYSKPIFPPSSGFLKGNEGNTI